MNDVIPVELVSVTPAIAAVLYGLRAARLPDRWTPLTAIGLGIGASVSVSLTVGSLGVVPAILGGAVIGAAATGGHQVYKQFTDQ